MGFEWTLDELAARVAAALGVGDYPGAPNGRVREVPDRRAIRWYTTIGLLDRPGGMRGRTALYGPRHLAQLVAIKRRQAQGRSLAEIQTELVGAADSVVFEIAGLDEAPEEVAPAAASRGAFWAQAPAVAPPESARAPAPALPESAQAPATTPPASAPAPAPPASARAPAPAPSASARTSADDGYQDVLTGVTLTGGAVLLLPTRPDHDDLAALRAAAAPLIDLLAARGLLHARREELT